MDDNFSGRFRVDPRLVTIVRWLARLWGLALLALAIVMVVTPDPYAAPDIRPAEYLIPLLLFGGATIGSLLAWRWEALGGAIVVAGWPASVICDHFVYDRWLPLPFMALIGLFFATPGFLFLLCWRLSRRPAGEPA